MPRMLRRNGDTMIDNSSMFKLSYGLFVLFARNNDKDNGCIINTAQQVTQDPLRISVTVNKENLTNMLIMRTGKLNISVLSENVPFDVIRQFGFVSGMNEEKVPAGKYNRSANGICYLSEYSNAYISADVIETVDLGTHTMFICDVTEAVKLSDEPSVTYDYYFKNIKPKPETAKKNGYVCKICGYVYEGDELPEDYICPICKHPASDFEPLA